MTDYNPNVPQAPSASIGQGQLDFLANFLTLYNSFAKNHITLDAAANAGNHTFVELVEQSQQFQTDIGEISLYSKLVENQTDQIFLRYQGNQTEFQFSTYQIYAVEPTSTQTTYFTFLPGNLLLYFGTLAVSLSVNDNFPMKLVPNVAKNIITMEFCPIGNTPSFPPWVNLEAPVNGYYSTINLKASSITNFPTQLFYIVLANL